MILNSLLSRPYRLYPSPFDWLWAQTTKPSFVAIVCCVCLSTATRWSGFPSMRPTHRSSNSASLPLNKWNAGEVSSATLAKRTQPIANVPDQ